MHDVAVLTNTGIPLMPTTRMRARTLLQKGRAVIAKYRPVFTIRLTDRSEGDTQPVELKMDTGYRNIGISVCSEKLEYLSREYRLLKDEPERHRDRRQYRRQRRNRLRYRKPRFDNRKGVISENGFAPSIRNLRDRHVDLVKAICSVLPVTDAYIEMGQFDTQVLKAMAEGKPLPQGTDYQQGERYGYAMLREAVFSRDNYTCSCCGKNAQKDGVILRIHHIGFWKGDRTNRMSNLMTVCDRCHSPKNHKPEGLLYGLKPKLKAFKGATFMTSVRWDMWKMMHTACPHVMFHMTYGAATKLARAELGIGKTHANDAYAMGTLHPKRRPQTQYFQKHRRNNRTLEKFYDATYTDIRDGETKKGTQLGCNRTDRSIPRNNDNNERVFRGPKQTKGRRSIRRHRYRFTAGSKVLYRGKVYVCGGQQNHGTRVMLKHYYPGQPKKQKSVDVGLVQPLRYAGAWEEVTKQQFYQQKEEAGSGIA